MKDDGTHYASANAIIKLLVRKVSDLELERDWNRQRSRELEAENEMLRELLDRQEKELLGLESKQEPAWPAPKAPIRH